MSTAPVMPTTRPTMTELDGMLRAISAATMTTKRGFAPFSMPVKAEVMRCSANGNMLRGKAIHNTPTQAMATRSCRRTGPRAAGKRDSVAKPIAMRRKVTPLGAMASSPSAMNRKDAPQIKPGGGEQKPLKCSSGRFGFGHGVSRLRH